MDLQKLSNEAEEILQMRIEMRAKDEGTRYAKKPLGKAALTRNRKEILAALVKRDVVIDQLRQSGFILCGSRYFGDAKWNSDWDFFIEASDAARELLDRLGFEDDHTHGCSDYRDGNTLEILVHFPERGCGHWLSWDHWPRSMQIHAALVRSRRLREHARELLRDEPKRVRSKARNWDLIYARLAAASLESEAGGGGAELGANYGTCETQSGAGSQSDKAERLAPGETP